MEYYVRYGLEFNPFVKNSKEILMTTSDFREAQTRLNYLLETKGFGVLTGGCVGLRRCVGVRQCEGLR